MRKSWCDCVIEIELKIEQKILSKRWTGDRGLELEKRAIAMSKKLNLKL